MLKIIGITNEDEKVFKITDRVGVTQTGAILKIEHNTFYNTLYVTNVNVTNVNVTEEIVKKHIFMPESMRVNDFVIDVVSNKINGDFYIFFDLEEELLEDLLEEYKLDEDEITFINKNNALEFVKYKSNCFIIDENEEVKYLLKEDKHVDGLKAILRALKYRVTEYEDFNYLNL